MLRSQRLKFGAQSGHFAFGGGCDVIAMAQVRQSLLAATRQVARLGADSGSEMPGIFNHPLPGCAQPALRFSRLLLSIPGSGFEISLGVRAFRRYDGRGFP